MKLCLRLLPLLAAVTAASAAARPADYFGIEVVDEATGRGVPLVELKTVNEVRYYTDSSGLVAIHEPSLEGKRVHFALRSHGYEAPKDGFGIAGVALTVQPGKVERIKIRRKNIAERLYRLTGEGIYRDTLLLGRKAPLKEPLLNARVMGCDSTQKAVYRGRLFWIWGDTQKPEYPLGNFHATGATSALPGKGGLDPARGVDYDYFKNPDGSMRAMAPVAGEGPTWLTGLVAVPENGRERLFAGYVKIRNQLEAYERGLARFNDEKGIFEAVARFPLDAPLHPTGHAVVRDGYAYFGDPFPWVRVPADGAALRDLSRYEAFTCLREGSTLKAPVLDRDAGGNLRYAWRRDAPPLVPEEQEKLIRRGLLKRAEAQVRFESAGKPVVPHAGTVHWNPYRKRWIMIATEIGGTSLLGEVWYAEAEKPEGPWLRAVKIVSHDDYSFYNPLHHPEFDQDGGRLIYFEGTYTRSFSGNPQPTPRYDYNQVMYRLDLSDPRLRAGGEKSTRVRLSPEGAGFALGDSGRRFVPWGVNYGNRGRLMEDFWAQDWETLAGDFREIRALGYNTVRVHLQYGKFMFGPDWPNAASFERLGKLVRLAEETGLYLDVTGLACYRPSDTPAWYDTLDERRRWSAQARFWEEVARTCAGSPALFCYDLMNEPLAPAGKRADRQWYSGSLFGGYDFLQYVALDQRERPRPAIARQWIRTLTAAIRKRDPSGLITVGLLPWTPKWGHLSGFVPEEVAPELDFISVHIYPEKGKVEEALTTLKQFAVGKPVVIEETFPLSCSPDELKEFMRKSRAHAAGWVGHYDGVTPSEYERKRAEGKLTLAESVWLSWLQLAEELRPELAAS